MNEQEIVDGTDLAAVGIDSLMAIELARRLKSGLRSLFKEHTGQSHNNPAGPVADFLGQHFE